MKLVRTHVLLVNEDVNVKGMTKALRETKVPEWKGEVFATARSDTRLQMIEMERLQSSTNSIQIFNKTLKT